MLCLHHCLLFIVFCCFAIRQIRGINSAAADTSKWSESPFWSKSHNALNLWRAHTHNLNGGHSRLKCLSWFFDEQFFYVFASFMAVFRAFLYLSDIVAPRAQSVHFWFAVFFFMSIFVNMCLCWWKNHHFVSLWVNIVDKQNPRNI